MTHLAFIRHHAASPRGSALVAVVFTLLVVAAIAGSLITQTRTDLILSRNIELAVESEFLAEAGIAMAIFSLSDPNNKAPFIPDGRAYSVTMDGKRLSVRIQSEAGKINLNQSPNPLLKRLLRVCSGEPQAELLGNAIEGHGAARGGPVKKFLTVDELRRLPGASAEPIAAIEPYVSVYTFREEPDFDLAPQKLKGLMSEAAERASAAAHTRPAGAQASRVGVFTITAALLDSASPASIRAIVYLTGDKREPYYVFDWRYGSGGPDSAACGESEAQ